MNFIQSPDGKLTLNAEKIEAFAITKSVITDEHGTSTDVFDVEVICERKDYVLCRCATFEEARETVNDTAKLLSAPYDPLTDFFGRRSKKDAN